MSAAPMPTLAQATTPRLRLVGEYEMDAERAPRVLTLDIEDYYHVEAGHGRVSKADWPHWPARVQQSTERLLELLAHHRVRATCFVLGDAAKRNPQLVRTIVEAGHEVACHGMMHDRLHRLDPQSLAADLSDAKALLEDQAGRAVRGYRAPTFSLTPQTAWAVDVLAKAGFTYDSSVFPVRHPQYGVPEAPAAPFWLTGYRGGARLLEVPPLTYRIGSRRLAAAGGGWFRMLPLTLMRAGLTQAQRDGRPAVLYFHPWEFDPGAPSLPLPLHQKMRCRIGLGSALGRLGRLLSGCDAKQGGWRPLGEHLAALRVTAERETGAFSLA